MENDYFPLCLLDSSIITFFINPVSQKHIEGKIHILEKQKFLSLLFTYLSHETLSRVMGWASNCSAFRCNSFVDDWDSPENNVSKLRAPFPSTRKFSAFDVPRDTQNECSLNPQGLADRRFRIPTPAKTTNFRNIRGLHQIQPRAAI